ncbi:hypothetical protein GQ472_02535 [archaeon]|nr:hypothetical protein [archaeon]
MASEISIAGNDLYPNGQRKVKNTGGNNIDAINNFYKDMCEMEIYNIYPDASESNRWFSNIYIPLANLDEYDDLKSCFDSETGELDKVRFISELNKTFNDYLNTENPILSLCIYYPALIYNNMVFPVSTESLVFGIYVKDINEDTDNYKCAESICNALLNDIIDSFDNSRVLPSPTISKPPVNNIIYLEEDELKNDNIFVDGTDNNDIKTDIKEITPAYMKFISHLNNMLNNQNL